MSTTPIVAAPTASTSPVVTGTSLGAVGAGALAILGALVASVTNNGFNLADAITALSGALFGAGGLATMGLHHNAALQHDAALAVAAVPDLEALRSDVNNVLPVVNRLVGDVAPGLEAKITAVEAKAKSDISAIATQVEATTGVTAAQAKALAHQTITEVLTALGVTLPAGLVPQTPPVTAGQAGAVDDPTLPTGN